MPPLHVILEKLSRTPYRFTNENDLHLGISRTLASLGVEFEREVKLSSKDRIDFMLGDIGLEVKIDGTLSNVTRQLWRYASLPQIQTLILVTTRTKHRIQPNQMNNKDIYVVSIIPAFF